MFEKIALFSQQSTLALSKLKDQLKDCLLCEFLKEMSSSGK
jgi:hypothetical protein